MTGAHRKARGMDDRQSIEPARPGRGGAGRRVFIAALLAAAVAACACSSKSSSGAPTGPEAGDDPVDAGSAADAPRSSDAADPRPATLCPDGLEGQVPDLAGAAFELVAAPPDDGFPAPNAFEILEGPVWAGNSLYVSHIAGGGAPPRARILKLEGGRLLEVLREGGGNGMAVDSRGDLIVARHSDGTVARLELSDLDAPAVTLVSEFEGKRFNSPNDLALSAADDLFFTDPDWQSPNPNPQAAERAYYVRAGQVAAFAGEVDKPNGVALSADGAFVYVGGTNGLFKYALTAGGPAPGGQRINAIGGGVDGLGKDCAGNLYVSSGDRVVVLNPADAEVGALNLAGVTNVAFGGPQGTTLYATTLRVPALHRVQLSIPGYPY